MVGEVRLAGDEQPGDVGLQVVVDPQAAHRVVDGGVDAHGDLVGVLPGDLRVHVEQVAVLLGDRLGAHPLEGVGEVEVDPTAEVADQRADTAALVADVLRLSRRDVAGDEVAERGVDPLEVVVAVLLGDVARVLVAVLAPLRHPDAAVVAQRLAHQRELGLVLAGDGDAGRVDLREARVAEVGALAVRPPRRRDVAAHRVGGEVVDVAVAAAREDHGVGEMGLDLAGDHVADDDAARPAVDDDELEHLVPGVHLQPALGDLPLQGLVCADEQLLAGLAARVEGPRHLHAAERAVVEQAAVLTREGHALRDALVDDVRADLGQPVDVRLPRAEVAALHGVVEQPVDRVAVGLVVLRRVDAALGRDGVRPAGRVLVAERRHLVAGLGQGRARGGAGQPGPHDDHAQLAPVRRVDQLGLELAPVPPVRDRSGRRLGVGDRLAGAVQPGGRTDVDIGHGSPTSRSR